jgi:hypothetical protein
LRVRDRRAQLGAEACLPQLACCKQGRDLLFLGNTGQVCASGAKGFLEKYFTGEWAKSAALKGRRYI